MAVNTPMTTSPQARHPSLALPGGIRPQNRMERGMREHGVCATNQIASGGQRAPPWHAASARKPQKLKRGSQGIGTHPNGLKGTESRRSCPSLPPSDRDEAQRAPHSDEPYSDEPHSNEGISMR
eukprot:CAMPEP_0119359258 /NCGR_PEP_ID=MMETSP1334-20130426/7193_1 /TAXON_ID=127549 /ORGANISM="Calcidiscus leptoporus, Strain RCC1130" /LENGTH=123 /DNA_ID=CAMNT_0007373897 /DNA_START=433 /DNA_END=801 /DNA_ORIENTATION=+